MDLMCPSQVAIAHSRILSESACEVLCHAVDVQRQRGKDTVDGEEVKLPGSHYSCVHSYFSGSPAKSEHGQIKRNYRKRGNPHYFIYIKEKGACTN